MEKLFICMKYEAPEILIDEKLRQKAELPIKRMMEISAKSKVI